ncbi:hypothetical protein GEV49_06025 [Streptomyces sp. SYP-A7193]|nr:hypothetical protein GEV49_06025 [Streptomyces sp. SYP-A7193]
MSPGGAPTGTPVGTPPRRAIRCPPPGDPMPSYEDDTRKVQTAVTGRPGSDQPVFLPFDHDDFDGFMRGRSRDDFYCGILLGGCGKQLTAKRYLHKKCHFAHRPPVHCRRTQTGEDSADHLYIGQALQRWLHRQGHEKVNVSYLDLGWGPGGAVEVRFGSGARLVRVQMGRMSLNQGEAIRAQFVDEDVCAQWAYGPNSGLAHNGVQTEGHAIRFTCRTEGGTRKVYVGTQHPDHSVELTTLDECHLTDDGIITPHMTGEPLIDITTDAGADTTAQLAFPIVPGRLAFTASVPAEEQTVTGRRLYHADVQPLGSVMTRMRIALPLHAVPPSPHRLNVIESTSHLIRQTDSSATEPSWLIEAVGFSSLPVRSDPPLAGPPARSGTSCTFRHRDGHSRASRAGQTLPQGTGSSCVVPQPHRLGDARRHNGHGAERHHPGRPRPSAHRGGSSTRRRQAGPLFSGRTNRR